MINKNFQTIAARITLSLGLLCTLTMSAKAQQPPGGEPDRIERDMVVRLFGNTANRSIFYMGTRIITYRGHALPVASSTNTNIPQRMQRVEPDGGLSYLRNDLTWQPLGDNPPEDAHTYGMEGAVCDYDGGLLFIWNFDPRGTVHSFYHDYGDNPGDAFEHGRSTGSLDGHNRCIAVAAGGQLVVGHIGRNDVAKWPTARVSKDRGRTFTWADDSGQTVNCGFATAFTWKNAPLEDGTRDDRILYISQLSDEHPPLAVFGLVNGEITLEAPHADRSKWFPEETLGTHVFDGATQTTYPLMIEGWPTRHGFFLRTNSNDLIRLETPYSLPAFFERSASRRGWEQRNIYFGYDDDLYRITAEGDVEVLENPSPIQWTHVTRIVRDHSIADWMRANASAEGTLFLFGTQPAAVTTHGNNDSAVATWQAGKALPAPAAR